MQNALEETVPIVCPAESSERGLRSDRICWTFFGAVALCLLSFGLPALFPHWRNLSAFYLDRQDKWLLLCAVVLLGLCCVRLRPRVSQLSLPPWTLWLAATLVVLVCFAGHRWFLADYDVSRDEQMATFDSLVYSAGRLAQPLPDFWQAHADVLNMRFMLPVSKPTAWVSAYLPMNAILRSFVALFADPALTGPLVTGLGLIFLYKCTRRLWPEDPEAALAAALLYIASGQVLFAGMTAYAMSALLTLDLLWLWLFLIGRRTTDLAAVTVAFVATGLHQPLFHPLFALPFVIGLARQRAWQRLGFYAVGYAVISCAWLGWPMLIHAVVTGPASHTDAMGTDYFTRLVDTLIHRDISPWSNMSGNLVRFAAWQSILLLPLMMAALMLTRHDRLTLALAISVALPVMLMTVILPYQGHGFGYRYLQPALGSAILMAVQGWRCLVREDQRFRPLLTRLTGASIIILLPLQASMAHAFYAPYAQIESRLRRSGADYAIVGEKDSVFSGGLVINRPDLSNRPLRLLSEHIDEALVAAICHPGVRVAMSTDALFKEVDSYFGTATSGAADESFDRLSGKLLSAGCSVERIGGR